jgi:hypothetical protein
MLTTHLQLTLRLNFSQATPVLPIYECLHGMHRNGSSFYIFYTDGTEILLVGHFSIQEAVFAGIMIASPQSTDLHNVHISYCSLYDVTTILSFSQVPCIEVFLYTHRRN